MQTKTIVSCHTADSKPVKQEVNGTVILPPLVFSGQTFTLVARYTVSQELTGRLRQKGRKPGRQASKCLTGIQ